ncbi:NAD(P)-dependent oxidoreductase [Rathayibacter rathayi]|uniref:NAD(P)-dependent oxidoreductase n=1 Tax=Rathayibacter rathayi TaxID=33887 RepID=A0ABX5AB39_RATRA|nr:NAD(P)H-binding protein [Rathayibacter rathayi]PPG94765.1 NAD(P)-dependent oxidoreductase [Rathayibacter rathayi]PPH37011.1 NAD(P)-dependent oxidoreductase [Rathayibacter rathayi]PPH69193.1 NAD(P)-dependent oxidoreductase [Rathayibacter rathayi]PPH76465.1 NAD(P)-dependent oxidoreductase [Rathayibacter rathayi]PPI60478.1 NAD(P)-dependent oxidoreductase [Rathayibacter rathayi]
MSTPIALTGVTGAVGGRVARELADAGHPLRLLVRDPSRAPELPETEVVRASFADTGDALEGVRLLVMVSAAENAERLAEHLAFVASAAAAGVEHVVYTSFAGAAPNAVFTLARDHAATEDAIRRSGMTWTFLRDNLYLDFLPAMLDEDGMIRGPAGQGRAAAVAREDVARAAAAILRAPEKHRGAAYELTGPEALTLDEVAAALTAAGRPAVFIDETLDEAYASRRRWNAPDWQLDAWISTYTAIAAGQLEHVSGDVQRLTGRAPLSLAGFLKREARG